MRQLNGFSSLIDRYDAFIVDLWGVLHDGVAAFPDALDCLGRMKRAGKTVIILSNAPRRAEAVAAGLVVDGQVGGHAVLVPAATMPR